MAPKDGCKLVNDKRQHRLPSKETCFTNLFLENHYPRMTTMQRQLYRQWPNENGLIPAEPVPNENPVAPLLAAAPPNTEVPVVEEPDVFAAPNENKEVPVEEVVVAVLLLVVLVVELSNVNALDSVVAFVSAVRKKKNDEHCVAPHEFVCTWYKCSGWVGGPEIRSKFPPSQIWCNLILVGWASRQVGGHDKFVLGLNMHQANSDVLRGWQGGWGSVSSH